MKVICDFTHSRRLHADGGGFETLSCFLPIMGKPFLQHVLEYVSRLGASSLVLFLSGNADRFERFVGDGERWGVKISYHLVKEGVSVHERIRNAAWMGSQEMFLLCNNAYLPCIDETHMHEPARFVLENGTETGWLLGTKTHLSVDAAPLRATVVEALHVGSAQSYLDALARVLGRRGGPLVVLGKELRPGVWVGPGTRIHPTCTLTAPVYIGSQVNLGEHTIIGPDSEIGSGCIVDNESSIIGSSILAGSYVGKHLDVRGCIVNQNTIFNAQLNSAYVAVDEILATSVESEDDSVRVLKIPLGSRLIACMLGLATLPLYTAVLLVNAVVYRRRTTRLAVVSMRQPATDEAIVSEPGLTLTIPILRHRSEMCKGVRSHALWILLPGLWTIVRGKSRFFGIPYRTKEDFGKLSTDWQNLYLKSNPGIITEADILYDEYPEDEMLFASEMYYRVVDSFAYNRSLLLRYIKALFTGRTS
ncbi:MAG: NDP-sugar synthase [Sphaerochaeta sp.]|nr:NDP-sugar synthase [Sphaerochaeta sp.]